MLTYMAIGSNVRVIGTMSPSPVDALGCDQKGRSLRPMTSSGIDKKLNPTFPLVEPNWDLQLSFPFEMKAK